MKNKFHIAFLAILALLPAMYAPWAEAQSCEAYYPFDGTLADASGNGFDGRMIGQDGAAATPRFVEGRSGQALAFDGTAAMRAFLDLNYESCPQVSFTAWIRVEGPVRRENQEILATGGSGPGLRAVGSVLVLNGTENGVWARDAVHGDSGWMFVAGVYDYANNTYTLHWRNRSVEGTLSQHRRPPADAVWVGAMNSNLTHPASNIVIDELRIVGRALDNEAIMAMRDAAAGAGPARLATVGADDRACVSHDGCPAGTYCAIEGTCHPDSHRPMARDAPAATTDSGRPTTAASLPAGLASDSEGLQRRIEENRPIDLGSESDSTAGSREIVTADVQDSLQERVEERRPIEFGYDSEEEGVAAAEAAAERREAEVATADAAGDTGQAQAAFPRPTGSPRFSAIAGTAGDARTIVDLQTQFLHLIEWVDSDSAPCQIGVWPLTARTWTRGERSEHWGSCGGIDLSREERSTAVGLPSNVVSAIEVCQRNGNQTLQGLRVVGTRVNPDGTMVYEPAVNFGMRPHCETWSPRVLCPQDHVGTGVVVHSREWQERDGRVIIGLQLVCRAVAVPGG